MPCPLVPRAQARTTTAALSSTSTAATMARSGRRSTMRRSRTHDTERCRSGERDDDTNSMVDEDHDDNRLLSGSRSELTSRNSQRRSSDQAHRDTPPTTRRRASPRHASERAHRELHWIQQFSGCGGNLLRTSSQRRAQPDILCDVDASELNMGLGGELGRSDAWAGR